MPTWIRWFTDRECSDWIVSLRENKEQARDRLSISSGTIGNVGCGIMYEVTDINPTELK
jgi:hypothetical protein